MWLSGEGLIWKSGSGVSLSSCHHLPAACSQESPVPPFLGSKHGGNVTGCPSSGTGTQQRLSWTADVKRYSLPVGTSQAGSELAKEMSGHMGPGTPASSTSLYPSQSPLVSPSISLLPAHLHPVARPSSLTPAPSEPGGTLGLTECNILPLGFREASPKPNLRMGKPREKASTIPTFLPSLHLGKSLSGSTVEGVREPVYHHVANPQ